MNKVDGNSNSALQAGMQGLRTANESMAKAAGQFASGSHNGQSSVANGDAIDLVTSRLQAEASAEVIERAAKRDGIIGSIIDTYA
jgi:hypothetical protein